MNATPAAKAPAPIPSLAVFVVAAYAGLQMLSDVASLKIGVVMGFAVDMGTFIYPFTFTLRDMAHKLVGKRGVRTLVVTAAAINLFMALYLGLCARAAPDADWGVEADARFKAVLGGASRALADEPEVELAFTADAPAQSGKHIKVPMPARTLPADQVAEARGFADGFALRLKHHNAALHLKAAPHDAVARAVFDAAEGARVEALGSRGYRGIADNLGHALDMRLRSDPITRARSRDEVPLSTAIGLLVRERLTGEEAPAVAQPGLALVREWIEEKAGSDLDALRQRLQFLAFAVRQPPRSGRPRFLRRGNLGFDRGLGRTRSRGYRCDLSLQPQPVAVAADALFPAPVTGRGKLAPQFRTRGG